MQRARSEVIDTVARLIPRPGNGDPVLVAIDGVDGAGKTRFADELGFAVRRHGRPVIRASVDSFHHQRALRHRRGRDSPSGFWLDSFDYARLRTDLLDPLSVGGTRRYRTASHDPESDAQLDPPLLPAEPGAVLVLDGLFLHRDELVGYWDLSVFLDVPFAETARRMADRDGSNPDPDHPSMRRYVDGQRLYLAACDPRGRADVVIDNSDWAQPVLRSAERGRDASPRPR